MGRGGMRIAPFAIRMRLALFALVALACCNCWSSLVPLALADAAGRRAGGTLSGALSLSVGATSNTAGNDEEEDDEDETLGESSRAEDRRTIKELTRTNKELTRQVKEVTTKNKELVAQKVAGRDQ